jgi:hypothetical protein
VAGVGIIGVKVSRAEVDGDSHNPEEPPLKKVRFLIPPEQSPAKKRLKGVVRKTPAKKRWSKSAKQTMSILKSCVDKSVECAERDEPSQNTDLSLCAANAAHLVNFLSL